MAVLPKNIRVPSILMEAIIAGTASIEDLDVYFSNALDFDDGGVGSAVSCLLNIHSLHA